MPCTELFVLPYDISPTIISQAVDNWCIFEPNCATVAVYQHSEVIWNGFSEVKWLAIEKLSPMCLNLCLAMPSVGRFSATVLPQSQKAPMLCQLTLPSRLEEQRWNVVAHTSTAPRMARVTCLTRVLSWPAPSAERARWVQTKLEFCGQANIDWKHENLILTACWSCPVAGALSRSVKCGMHGADINGSLGHGLWCCYWGAKHAPTCHHLEYQKPKTIAG